MARSDLLALAELAQQVVQQAEAEDRKAMFPGSTVAEVGAVLAAVQAANRGMATAAAVAAGDGKQLKDVPDKDLSKLLEPLRSRARRLEGLLLSGESFLPKPPPSPAKASGRAFRDAVQAAAELLPDGCAWGPPIHRALSLVVAPGDEVGTPAAPRGHGSSPEALLALAEEARRLAEKRAAAAKEDKQKKALARTLKDELVTAVQRCRSFALLVAPDSDLSSFTRAQVETARDQLEAGRDKVLAQVAVRSHLRTTPPGRAAQPRVRGSDAAKLSPGSAKRPRRSSNSWGRPGS